MSSFIIDVPKQEVSIGDIVLSSINPRKTFRPSSITELAVSIRSMGVIQPIVLRLVPGNGHKEVIAGQRRFLAAQEAGLATVPALVIEDLTDVQAIEIGNVENLQREGVHPMEEALSYQDLMERAGYDVTALCARFGRSEHYIFRRLQFCKLIPEAREKFMAREMLPGHAFQLSRLQDYQQKEALENCWRHGMPGLETLKRFIEEHVLSALGNVPFKLADAELLPAAGSCVDCTKRTGNAGMLWGDVGKNDCCTDPVCLQSKVDAFLDRKRAKLAKKKDGFVQISTQYHYNDAAIPEGVLASNKYTVAAKGECEHVKPALVVEGRPKELGATMQVCTDPDCKVHGRNRYAGKADNTYAEEQREAIRLSEMDTRIRSRTIAGVAARFKTLKRADLEFLAYEFTDRLTADEQKCLWRFQQQYGVPAQRTNWVIPPKTMGHPPHDHLKGTLAGMTDDQLGQYLLVMGLHRYAKTYTNSTRRGKYDDALFQTAERYKVPVEDIVEHGKAEKKARMKKGNDRKEALAKLKEPDAKAVTLAAKPLVEVLKDGDAA